MSTAGTRKKSGAKSSRTPESLTPHPLPQDSAAYALTSWGEETEYDYEVPSGQKCRLRRIEPEELMEMGVLDKINSLNGVVVANITKSQGNPPVDVNKILASPKKFAELVSLVDSIVCRCVVAPAVFPNDAEEIPPGSVRVGQIRAADKYDIFGEVMGDVDKLKGFRGGSDEPGDGVAEQSSDEVSTE